MGYFDGRARNLECKRRCTLVQEVRCLPHNWYLQENTHTVQLSMMVEEPQLLITQDKIQRFQSLDSQVSSQASVSLSRQPPLDR